MSAQTDLVKRRPTETVSGIALATVVYGFLAESGVANAIALIVAMVVAFGPGLVTAIVDRTRADGPGHE